MNEEAICQSNLSSRNLPKYFLACQLIINYSKLVYLLLKILLKIVYFYDHLISISFLSAIVQSLTLFIPASSHQIGSL